MLATVQEQFFPNTEVVLVNLTSGEKAPLNDMMGLMSLVASPGEQVEFITTLDKKAFKEFRTIISLLSYTRLAYGRVCKSVLMVDSYSTYVAECNGQPQLLIEKLRKDSNAERQDLIFSDTLPPKAFVPMHAIEKVFSNPELGLDGKPKPCDVNRRLFNTRLLSMVEAVSLARDSKDAMQVEARFQDLRAYCDEQMRVRKSAFLPLVLAETSSDMDEKIGFLEWAVAVSRETGQQIFWLLYMEGVSLLQQERFDYSRKWLTEARDAATASGVEHLPTIITKLLNDTNRT